MNTARIVRVALLALLAAGCQTPATKQSKAGGDRPHLLGGGTRPADGGQPLEQSVAAVEIAAADPQPATAPAGGANGAPPANGAAANGADQPELLQSTTGMTGYGEEVYRIVSSPNEVITVLKNGVTVICKRVASPVVSVRGYCNTGGVYEGKWLGGGLSHLLEHLVAGGSSEVRTEEQNRDLLQKIGNDSNAYTTEDHTSFFINTTTEHMDEAADLVCGWMLGAKITVPEYKREYQVVQRELEMGKGTPDRVFYYLTASNRYRVNPARVPVIGYQEVIQGLSRDDVYSYYKLAYVPNNLTFTIAGDLPPDKMLAAIQNHVKQAKPGREFSHDIPAEPPVLSPRTVVATFPKLGEARLELAFPGVRLTDPDVYALDVLSTALGGGESALLVQVLRDEKQLASVVSANDDTPSYAEGSFAVDLQLDPAKLQEATKVTLDLLNRVAADGIDAGRIERAKTQMKAAFVKKMQTSEDVAETMATDLLASGDAHYSEHYIAAVAKITPEQVRAVAAKYFLTSRLLTTALLPAEFAGAAGLPKAEDLLRSAAPAATQPSEPFADSEITKVDLGNNTVLLTKRITTSPLVVMQLYSLGGLTAEDEKTNGLGHLTMQMVSRGTKTRDARQIAEFWDSIGGDFDATSGNNSWTWTATCLKDDFAKAYGAFADEVNNPTFPDGELTPMKTRVAAAIAAQDSDWEAQAFRFFKKTYYGPLSSPYQFMAFGTPQNVGGFTAAQVREWYLKHVLAGKKVVAVFGDVDAKTVEAAVRKMALASGTSEPGDPLKRAPITLGSKPAMPRTAGSYFENGEAAAAGNPTWVSAKFAADVAAAAPAQGKTPSVDVTKVAVNKTEQALAGIVIGYKSDSVVGEPGVFPIAVGGTMASGYQYGAGYLYEILRGRGLVYVVAGQNSPGISKDLPGTFLVYAGCEPDKVNEVVDVILENIARLQGTPADVNEDWYKRSKELIVVAEAMENQTPAQQATQASLDELYGLGYDWHKKFAAGIRAVTLDQVRAIAAGRLRQCVVTVSTPKPELVGAKGGTRQYPSFPKVEMTPRGVQHDSGTSK